MTETPNKMLRRRSFLKKFAGVAGALTLSNCAWLRGAVLSNKTMEIRISTKRPNVILCMCDDLGWGFPKVGFWVEFS